MGSFKSERERKKTPLVLNMIFQRAVCRQVSDALRRGLSHSGRAGQAAAFDVPAGKTIKEIVEGLNDKDRAEFEEHLGRLSVESPGQRWARLNADPKDPGQPSWLQCRISFVHNMVPFHRIWLSRQLGDDPGG